MTRQWVKRDRAAEQDALKQASADLLATLTPESETPTVTELAKQANLRRDYLYDYPEIVKEFQLNVGRATGRSAKYRALEVKIKKASETIAQLRDQLSQREQEVRHLQLLLAETTLAAQGTKRTGPARTPAGGLRAVPPVEGGQ